MLSLSFSCFAALGDDKSVHDDWVSLVRLGRRLRFRAASFFDVVAADRASINMSDSIRTGAADDKETKKNE